MTNVTRKITADAARQPSSNPSRRSACHMMRLHHTAHNVPDVAQALVGMASILQAPPWTSLSCCPSGGDELSCTSTSFYWKTAAHHKARRWRLKAIASICCQPGSTCSCCLKKLWPWLQCKYDLIRKYFGDIQLGCLSIITVLLKLRCTAQGLRAQAKLGYHTCQAVLVRRPADVCRIRPFLFGIQIYLQSRMDVGMQHPPLSHCATVLVAPRHQLSILPHSKAAGATTTRPLQP